MNHQARWDEGDVGLAVWVSDEAEGYIEATITAIAGNTVTAQTKANKRVHVDVQLALQPPKRGRKEEVRRILPRSTGGPPNGVENMDDLVSTCVQTYQVSEYLFPRTWADHAE
jgi:hypothetical protein